MNLRKIEISGFKSFLNRLEMDFSGGITAVLGPNGCGKTNIVDSIRWVLGEQKTRMLRNTKMENVIFNGTKLRKPLGMAEVRMTLSNEDHKLPVDFDEIAISRKLYRSGVSEYSINGELARLKDIKSLLVDSGLGSHTYSIIEREMVDSVISEKDNDKRFLLEEAAGVMRYRIQREEALRKIKHTETDLTRLGDILVELEKEIRSLRYQMGKARRYGRLKEKVDQMEAALIKRSLFEFLEKSAAVYRDKEHHEGITLADENEIALMENQLQEARIKGSELEGQLQDFHEKRYDLSQSLQQHEEKIAILTERIASHNNRIAEDEDEVERSTTKLGTLAEDLEGFNVTIGQSEAELMQRHEALRIDETALRTVGSELSTLKEQLRDKKQLALEFVREKERERGIREHLETRLKELEEKNERDNTLRQTLGGEEDNLVGRVSELEEYVTVRRESLAAATKAIESAAKRSDKVVDLVAHCEDLYSQANIELHRCKEKKEYLERIKEEHARSGHELFSDRVKGIVADHVRVDREYRKCFEACLSPVLPALLAHSKEDALGCLQDIRQARNGRVQLLYPNGNGDGSRGRDSRDSGGLGSALDLLGGNREEVANYLGPYLADVVVVNNVEDALGLLAREPETRVATLDGVFFDGPGRIQVAASDDVDMTLLEFESKIGELTDSIGSSQRRAERLQQRKEMLVAEKRRLAGEVERLRERQRSEEAAKEQVSDEKRGHEIELVRVREKLATLTDKKTEEQGEIEDIRLKLVTQPERREERTDVQLTDDELTRLEYRVVELEREKESVAEAASAIRLEVATITGEIATAKEKRNNIEMLEGELRELITSRREDAARCRVEIEVAESDIRGSRGDIAQLHEQVETIEKQIESVKEAYEGVKENCVGLEKQIKELKDRRDQKRENLQRCSLEIATIETRISGLLDKAQENFGQDLEPYVKNRERFDATEWEQLNLDELTDLRSRVETFGPVNMLALEEFKEKKERFDFLSGQKQDLEEAKETLVQAIRRINREARRRLSETFEIVRNNFKSTFLTLFDGGEADLLFVDSDDPLEANIKIVASPKGKRLHDISSLSGGERALVALSLLFAIYLVKPSPFCVFDEVDAPLDDANIGRFVNMLKSFTNRTQFIVITHNKKTMEAADHLYGVTMEEAGVSKMVSVHIGDVDKFRDKEPPRRRRNPNEPSQQEVSV